MGPAHQYSAMRATSKVARSAFLAENSATPLSLRVLPVRPHKTVSALAVPRFTSQEDIVLLALPTEPAGQSTA